MNISKVAVLGFGTMGAGIVQLVAQNGFEVVVLEADENRLEAGRQRVVDFLDGGISRGKIREEEKQQTLSRINGVVDVAALVDVDLVIEAVTEIPEVKKDLFNRVAEVVGPEVLSRLL